VTVYPPLRRTGRKNFRFGQQRTKKLGRFAEGLLAGRQQEIHAERDPKLEVARKPRQIRRQQTA
jgi:hypothetical protein